MVDKITYEEALVEKLTKAMKEVVEQLNENDLWSKATTHNSPMHDSPKGDGDIQKVTRPKAENVSEKNPVGGVISKAPVRNPRRAKYDAVMANDDLTMEEYEKLFKEKVDPIIESEEAKDRPFARIDTKDLEMSPNRALEVAKELYKNLDYSLIFLNNSGEGVRLIFDLRL